MAPLVSVVVPVLDDAPAVDRLLRHAPPHPLVEMLVVDGGRRPAPGRLNKCPPRRQAAQIPARAGAPDERGRRRGRGGLAAVPARRLDPAGRLGRGHRRRRPGSRRRLVPVRARRRAPGRRGGSSGRWRGGSDCCACRTATRGISCGASVFAALGGFDEMPADGGRRVRPPPRRGGAGRRAAAAARDLGAALAGRRLAAPQRPQPALVSLYFAGVPPARLARWYERKSPQKADSIEA